MAVYPFIYPFERTTVRDIIGDVFDKEGKRNPRYKDAVVNKFLKQLARDSLIPQSLTGKPLLSTRGTGDKSLEEYFSSTYLEMIAEANRIRDEDSKPKPKPKPKLKLAVNNTPKPDSFFETFSVPNSLDQKLVRLAWEISNIKWADFPIASAMLMRSLLEEVLREHLKRVGKLDECKRANQNREGLKGMIIFSATKANSVFKDMKTADQLARFQNSAVKDDLDNVVHNRFGSISKESLAAIAPYARPIIETIIHDEWL